jgi:hypothetical protein
MKNKIIIHVVGAASSRRMCLSDLKKEIGGASLFFSYRPVLHVHKLDQLEDCYIKWIRETVGGQNLILTSGLPVKSAKVWLKKAFPDCQFRHLVWEVHHNPLSENLIAKERTCRFIFEGLLNHARKALKLGLRPKTEIVRETLLGDAMEFEEMSDADINVFIEHLSKKQELENMINTKNSIICVESFDPIERRKSIQLIAGLVGKQNYTQASMT